MTKTTLTRLEALGSYASILGVILSIVLALNDKNIMALISVAAVVGALLALVALRRRITQLKESRTEIEGLSLDLVNIANLANRPNKYVHISAVHHEVTIEFDSVNFVCRESGTCNAQEGVAGLDFTVGCDENIPYSQLECFGYDLLADPNRENEIRPLLRGPDGISKSIFVPVRNYVNEKEKISVELHARVPRLDRCGKDYHAAILCYGKYVVQSFSIQLKFVGLRVEGVRVYSLEKGGFTRMQRSLAPSSIGRIGASVQQAQEIACYSEDLKDYPANSTRVYVFDILSREGVP